MSSHQSLLKRFGILDAFKGIKVMAIDDSQVFLKAIDSILNQVGCVIHQCQESPTAITEATQFMPDIIIIDYEMPKIDGPQLCRIFKTHHLFRSTPIILLTSRDDTESMLTALDAGADDFISKSVLAEVLIAKTGCMLRLRNLHQELTAFKEFEAIRNLVATYNHEFNNALTILDGYIRLLEKSTESINKDKIDKLKQTSKRMSEIVRKLSNLKEYEKEKYGKDGTMLKI